MSKDDSNFVLAQEFWSAEALQLSLLEFQSRFDLILSSTQDIRTLWQLGGAANDFMRHHPGQVVLCENLALRLLSADFSDARIIGLKLLVRLNQDSEETTKWICEALLSEEEYEIYGGLYELGNFISENYAIGDPARSLLIETVKKVNISQDEDISESANRCLQQLQKPC